MSAAASSFRGAPRWAVVRAVLRVGFKEAVAYRAELFLWVVSTTMPLVMLALFVAVAREKPLGRYGEDEFIAYFLSSFIVRQLAGSWAGWQISVDVKQGDMNTRLLRPVHPLLVYGLEGLAAIPLRLVLAMPLAVGAIAVFARHGISRSPVAWAVFVVSILLAWLISLFINFAIGSLAFFIDSSGRVMDLYVSVFFVASGYLVPTDLFPPGARAVLDVLPFRYQLSFPVELMTGRFDAAISQALGPLAIQLTWVLLTAALASFTWNRGLRRFGAFGG